ncbi:hypothetical protein ACYJ1Y_11495 [Natrialbaceae archaeon A-gly3]
MALSSSIAVPTVAGAPTEPRREPSARTALEATQYTATSRTPDWWRETEAGGVLEHFETETTARETLDFTILEGEDVVVRIVDGWGEEHDVGVSDLDR